MIRPRLLAAAGVMALATAMLGIPGSGSSAQSASGAPPRGPIIVIGTGGLSWSDVSARATPALSTALRNGATANLTVHAVHANTCPVDGWLTLSAGEQASAGGTGAKPACQGLPSGMTPGTVPRWDRYLAAAAATRFDASLGLLGDQIASHGSCVQAIGHGAALGAARADGTVDLYQAYDGRTLAAALARCPAALVDVGPVRDPDDVDPADEIRPTTTRSRQVQAVEARVAAVRKAAPAGADVVLASLADAGTTERLRLLAASGPSFGTGTVESRSTRQPGLVQLTDLTPTILQHLDIPSPPSLGGTPLRVIPAEGSVQAARERLRSLLDQDQASHYVHALVEPVFYGWGLLQIAVYAVAGLIWWRGWGDEAQRRRLLAGTRRVAVVAATVPVSTFLANLLPWWRFSTPLVSVVASVALFAVAISALALLGPWRRQLLGPLVVVCSTTMTVLALDVMTGSRLQLSSLMGLQPVIGGRFYGMGNVTFALFATATLLLCVALGNHLVAIGRPRSAAAAVAMTGLGAVIVDASPSWGSDFGGPSALLPAVILLALTILQARPSWPLVLGVGGGIGGFVVILGWLDWLRPAESRSHLGRFVTTTLDGDAWDIIARKLEQNITLLFGNPLLPLIPVALVLLAYLLARPRSVAAVPLQGSFVRIPLLRQGLVALLVMWVLGFVLNDSGAAIPAAGGTLALPLLIAVALRTLEEQSAAHLKERATARTGPA